MPKIKKENQQRDYTVYALVSQDKEVFVGKIQKGNHYQAYKDNINGKKAESREFCQRCEAAGSLPKMYRLDDVRAPARMAYRYRLAWYRYFADRGYSVIAYPGTKDNMAELLDDTLTIYKVIRELEPEEVLNEENLLVGNYQRKTEQAPKKESITVHVSPKQYDQIKKKADQAGLSVSLYCKNTALKGSIVKIDIADFVKLEKYTSELRGAKNILRMILAAIFQNGKPYRADVENVQRLVDTIVAGEKELSKNYLIFCDELQKLLPK